MVEYANSLILVSTVDVLGHDGMIYEKSANEAPKYAAFVNLLSDLHYHGYLRLSIDCQIYIITVIV